MANERITGNQYLTFKLAEEVYGIDISQVREVLEYTAITAVPRTPDFMRGVINLRGGVVPVVDMRLKFGLLKTEVTINTCIVIMEIMFDEDVALIGALVDSVQEVLELDPSQIEPPPKIGTGLKTEFIKGMGKHEENFIIILDVDMIFSAQELDILQKVQ